MIRSLGFALSVIGSLAAVLAVASGASAQGLGVTSLNENAPIEVEADRGIEWRRDEKVFVARGNATAKQGSLIVHADVLTARYKDDGGSGTKVYRVEAEGNLRIVSNGNTLRGEHGVYDLEKDVMTVTGSGLELVTPEQRVVSDQSMVFDNKRQTATAKGNATVARGDQRIRADVLTAFFAPGAQGKAAISRIEGEGNVLVSTPTEIARATKGTYDLNGGTATLSGSVRITRGENQLNGERAEIDLRSGLSRLTGAPGQGQGRVRALIVPGRRSDG